MAGIGRPEESPPGPVEVTILLEVSDPLAEGTRIQAEEGITLLGVVIMEAILTRGEGMVTTGEDIILTTEDITRTTEGGIPTTEGGRITGAGTPTVGGTHTAGGIRITEDGIRTIGGMVPGTDRGIFHQDMFLLRLLFTRRCPLPRLLTHQSNNPTLSLILPLLRNMGNLMRRQAQQGNGSLSRASM